MCTSTPIVPAWKILSYYETQTLSYQNHWIPWMDTPRSCPLGPCYRLLHIGFRTKGSEPAERAPIIKSAKSSQSQKLILRC